MNATSRRQFLRSAFGQAAATAMLAGTPWNGWLHAAPIDRPSSAQAIGWSQSKLDDAKRLAERLGTTALTIVWRGRIVDEWGRPEQSILCHSIRKSLISGLFGIAVAERRIDATQTLRSLEIDDLQGLSEIERSARIVDLLTARSGIYHPSAAEPASMRANRPARGSHRPGTYWFYNNWDFNALGTIYRRLTGDDIFQAFKAKIADPIGMEHFRVDRCFYQTEPVSQHPAYHFRMSGRDLARFGLLYLNRGRDDGRQIIPSQWIADSTRSYSNAQPGVGYGYMWWVALDGWHFGVRVGPGTYSARGVGGNFLVVAPSRDLVISHRVDWERTRAEINNQQFGAILRLILEAMP